MRLFISDLHLQQERPDITGAFLSFLRDTAAGARSGLAMMPWAVLS